MKTAAEIHWQPFVCRMACKLGGGIDCTVSCRIYDLAIPCGITPTRRSHLLMKPHERNSVEPDCIHSIHLTNYPFRWYLSGTRWLFLSSSQRKYMELFFTLVARRWLVTCIATGPAPAAPKMVIASAGDAIPYCPKAKLAIPIAASMPADVIKRALLFFMARFILFISGSISSVFSSEIVELSIGFPLRPLVIESRNTAKDSSFLDYYK